MHKQKVSSQKISSPKIGKLKPLFLGLGTAAVALLGVPAGAQNPNPNPLVTGKRITLPPLGTQTNVGSLPMNMILIPGGRYAVSTDMGFRQGLACISTVTGALAQPITAPAPINPDGSPAGLPVSKSIIQFGPAGAGGVYGPPGLYYGLAAQSNGDGTSTLYASEGASNAIAVVTVGADGSLTLKQTFPLSVGDFISKVGDFAAGVALDGRGNLYVAANESYPAPALSNIETPGSLLVLDASSGAIKSRYSFNIQVGLKADGKTPFSPTNFPLAVAATAAGKVYVTSQRDANVLVVDCADPANPKAGKTIPTGAHPISLLLNKAQTSLYVANAHSETVSVVSTATDAVTSTILLLPSGAHGLPGATPTGLALTPDESRLYVSLGDLNAVAVVGLAAGQTVGYIPAGWYPSAVVASPFKKQILVADAKGTRTRYPNPEYKQFSFAGQYDLNLIEGSVQTIPVPNSAQLPVETQQVLANNRLADIGTASPTTVTSANPLAGINLQAGKIKHVFYIVKENRTYDQVLGDEPQGNGDPALVLFGKDVTPNLHALAERFVLLDNFYDCGEASGDGWPWSTQGQASEYVIKNLPYNYSGRGRNYDFEGTNNNYPVGGFPATDPYGQPLVPNSPFHDLTDGGKAPAIPDVSKAPGGHIWDDALRNIDLSGTGLVNKYRNYGFFAVFGDNVATPDNYPADAGLQPAGHDGGGITDIDFRRYDAAYADSEGPLKTGIPTALYPTKTYGHYAQPSRFTEWNREFQQMLTNDSTGSTVPAFETVRFMHDHTQGMSVGRHSPRAEVADNDYGVGQFVEAISKSTIWNSSAIFVIEDDAQDGPDHVDGHRSTCFVISPFIKRASVDHTFYNTDSVLKTMELLLNIPPMNQYDAVASPILDFGTDAANAGPYASTLPAAGILSEITPPAKMGSALFPLEQISAKMDFVHPDSAPAALLNEIIWKSVKGVHSRMPATHHSGLVQARPASPKAAAHAPVKDGDGD